MASTNKDSKFFRLLNALPQELYDEITELARPQITSVQPPKIIAINKSYTPPSQLQLNRQLRNTLAPIYYSNTTFIGHYDDVQRWLDALPPEHRAKILKIKCWVDGEEDDLTEKVFKLAATISDHGWISGSVGVFRTEQMVSRS